MLRLLQYAAALIAGCCFGYGVGSLLAGDTGDAGFYAFLGIALYIASILPAPEAGCDYSALD